MIASLKKGDRDCRQVVIRYLRRSKPQFTILIGSLARRKTRPTSDVDIVRIGHRRPLSGAFRGLRQKGELSYIDYTAEKFAELFQGGSLFLYHVFNEGSLLQGDLKVWNELKRCFKVSTDFHSEISQNRRVLTWLQRGNKARGATIPYLAHTFRALKNLAIFSLAQNRDYIFDKRRALQRAFPSLDRRSIDVLIGANDLFEAKKRKIGHYDLDENAVARVKRDIATTIQSSRVHAHR